MTELRTVRRSIHPTGDDTWESIAARELPELAVEEAVSSLQSWNLHVFARPKPPEGSPRGDNTILPSDILFLEPPIAS